MKIFPALILAFLVLSFNLGSCSQRKPAEITTEAEQITTTDSTPVVASTDSIDSISLDPQTQETALQQDPPSSKPKTTGGCNPELILLPNPSADHHIFQVKRFDPSDIKCWYAIQDNSLKFCRDKMPCEISYIEFSNPPYSMDATQLRNHGIGYFIFKNSTWELKGAKIWNRPGKGYEYYHTNKY